MPRLRVGSIVIRVDDLELEASFWAAALGYERRVDDSDDVVLLFPPDRKGPNLSLDAHGAAPRVPPRVCSPGSTATCTRRTRPPRSPG